MVGEADEVEANRSPGSPDISAAPTNSPSARVGTSRPASRWMIGGALIFATAALAGLFLSARSSTNDARDDPGARPTAVQAVTATSTPVAVTPPVDPRQTTEALQRSAAAQLQVPTAATDSASSDPAAAPGPMAGEPTGLWLFYGGKDHLQRLDLDTGVVDTFGVRAVPIVASGTELVLMTNDSGAIGWVALADPNEQGDGWIDARVAGDPTPGFLWRYNLGDETWTRLDLRSDLIVERREAPRQVFPELRTDYQQPTVAGPELVATPNGLYEYRSDRYVRVGAGTVFAYTDTDVLIESCGDALESCVTAWFDRATFEPSDPPPSPLPSGRLYSAQFVARGSWLHLLYDNGGSYLVSTTTDRVIEIASDTATIAVSPDGAWLARGTQRGTVELVRLASGETVATLAAFTIRDGGAMLFVEH